MENNTTLETQTQNDLQNTGENQEQNNKTFTQEEVDDIVKNRLARERRKLEAAKESEPDGEKSLKERELRVTAREKLLDAGLPTSLADILRYSDEKSIEQAIEAIKNLKQGPVGKAWGARMGGHKMQSDPIRKAMGLDHQKG